MYCLLFVVPLCLHGGELLFVVGELFAYAFKARLRNVVLFLGERLFFNFKLQYPAVEGVHFGGHGVYLRPYHRRRLVHEVDSLVGQETVGDIAVRKGSRRHERVVVNAHAVENFEPLFKSAQYGNGVLYRRLVYHNGLETAGEGGVLLDIFSVFVEGGRAYAVQFAARQKRLQKVARVHGSVGLARAHHGVQLVYEQQYSALGFRHFAQNGFQPLFKLAAVLRACNERAHVEGEQRFVFKPFGHVALDYSLGKSFGYRRLAHARFAY